MVVFSITFFHFWVCPVCQLCQLSMSWEVIQWSEMDQMIRKGASIFKLTSGKTSVGFVSSVYLLQQMKSKWGSSNNIWELPPFQNTGLLFKAIRLNCREWGAGETHYTSTRLHRLGGGDVKEENSLSCHSHRIQIWVHSTRYYDGLMRNARQTSHRPKSWKKIRNF